jgi:Holliday junction resolvasome RuvABC endonuclease subunit
MRPGCPVEVPWILGVLEKRGATGYSIEVYPDGPECWGGFVSAHRHKNNKRKNPMRVLALDMTLTNTGFSVWQYGVGRVDGAAPPERLPVTCGCITPEIVKSRDYAMVQDIRRCQELDRLLTRVLQANHVQAVVVELLEGTQNARAAQTFGLVTGVLASIMERFKLPFYAYRAQAVKKALTGRQSATKEEMIQAADELFPGFFAKNGFAKKLRKGQTKSQWPTKLEHVADSVCLMIYAEQQPDFRSVLQLSRMVQTNKGVVEFD